MNKTPEGLAAEMQHREQVIRKLYNLVTEHHEDSVMRDENFECPVCILPEHRRLMQEAWEMLQGRNDEFYARFPGRSNSGGPQDRTT